MPRSPTSPIDARPDADEILSRLTAQDPKQSTRGDTLVILDSTCGINGSWNLSRGFIYQSLDGLGKACSLAGGYRASVAYACLNAVAVVDTDPRVLVGVLSALLLSTAGLSQRRGCNQIWYLKTHVIYPVDMYYCSSACLPNLDRTAKFLPSARRPSYCVESGMSERWLRLFSWRFRLPLPFQFNADISRRWRRRYCLRLRLRLRGGRRRFQNIRGQ